MTQEELINKRGGFEVDPGVVVSGPYQALHHTSLKFKYDVDIVVPESESSESEDDTDPTDFDLNTPLPEGYNLRYVVNLRGGTQISGYDGSTITTESFAVYAKYDQSRDWYDFKCTISDDITDRVEPLLTREGYIFTGFKEGKPSDIFEQMFVNGGESEITDATFTATWKPESEIKTSGTINIIARNRVVDEASDPQEVPIVVDLSDTDEAIGEHITTTIQQELDLDTGEVLLSLPNIESGYIDGGHASGDNNLVTYIRLMNSGDVINFDINSIV